MAEISTEQQQVNYLVMALALSGISVNAVTADLIIETWGAICKKGGQFSIEDACNIELDIRHKYKQKVTVTAIKEEIPVEPIPYDTLH